MATNALNSIKPAETESDRTQRQDDAQIAKAQALSRGHPLAISVPGLTTVRCLGEGAYGSVWLAREKNTGKLVAVKVYSHRGGLDWSLLSREVEKLAVLYTSRNIVGLLDVGWDSDPPYYVMEYLERGSLAAHLADGPLSAREAVRIGRGILQALVHAHGSGILHCDLKPANVLLDSDFEPRLCDFGQSRLSYEQDPALGTLFYMAPEQADLKAVPDARWDVYALGAVLYHLLCGEPPHRTSENERRIQQAGSLEERLAAYRDIVETSPRPALHRRRQGVDRRLAEIVDRCLQPDPDKRFPNAQAVLDALDQRDRAKSFRPLLALGGLGPVSLMLALGLFYFDSMRDAVDSATTNLTTRALESDVLSVEILARSVARELDKRRAELEEVAAKPELQQAIESASERNWTDRDELWLVLAHAKSVADQLQKKLGLNRDRSWFLTDHQGFQRWREPENEETLDKNYSYRDYFHGLGKAIKEGEVSEGLQPITRPYLSLTYLSTATRRLAVSLAVPVWDKKHERVMGVLARSMELGQLLSPFAPSKPREGDADVNRTVVLIDERDWRLLDHPWLRQQILASEDVDDWETLRLELAPDTIEALKPHLRSTDQAAAPVAFPMDDYLDPAGQFDEKAFGGQWLAAFCRVGNTGWIAIVQERRSVALRPVDKLATSLRHDGVWALVISGVLIGTLWLVVLRGLHERSERAGSQTQPNPRP